MPGLVPGMHVLKPPLLEDADGDANSQLLQFRL